MLLQLRHYISYSITTSTTSPFLLLLLPVKLIISLSLNNALC
jgi:hypothetical protein